MKECAAMKTTKSNQLHLDADLFEQPVANKKKRKLRAASESDSLIAKAPPAPSVQPFLPGLSRRGRPRKKNPLPPVVRASESRKRRIGAGVKRIEVLLEPEVAVMLEALMAHHQASRVELLSQLIQKAAKRLQRKETDKASGR